jgi:hypothetical protein
MDVPDFLVIPVSESCRADMMLLPGAKMSTQLPQLLKLDLSSALVVEPTVIAFGTNAGVLVQASVFSLPAATTTTTPAATAASTAIRVAESVPDPPRLMLATDGRMALASAVIQSIAASMPIVLPLPSSPSTFTA